MATKEAIEALLDNEAWDFKSKIEDELYGRAAEALQTKRFEVGSEMFSVEETDTVEKDKEGKVKSWQHTGDWKKSDNKNPRGRVTNLSGIARKKSKILKRQDTDAERLSSKMNKEEVEGLDEISQETKKSYVKGASKDLDRTTDSHDSYSMMKNPAGKAVADALKKKMDKRKRGLARATSEETDTVEKDKEGKVKSWQHTGDWKKSDNKNPRGRVTNLSGIARKKSKILKRQDTDADTLKANLKTASAAARLSSKMNKEEVEKLDELSPELLARAAVKAAGQSVAAKRGFGNKSATKAGSQASKFRMGQIMRKRKAAADLETDSESK